MVVDKELLALSDVANLCGTTKSNVSNWRTRDKRFPAPYEDTSAGPIWKAEDIVMYLQQKNEYDVISTGNLKTKRIAVIGRARGGKSFLNSRFVKDRTGFQKLYCGNNNDKTACPIYVKISEVVTIESYVFHTDFNSIYHDGDSEEVAEVRAKVSDLVDNSFSQENKDKMLEIEDVIRKIRSIEEEYPGRKPSRTYIDTYQKPSEFCKELLRECRLGSIEIVDTPGVSGNVEASRVAKSDIYIFLVKPDNGDESQTIKRIVTQIKAEVATSKVAFLYKKEGIFLSQKKYEDARTAVKNDMAVYTELFSDLKGSIISTELDVLDPASHCILFPTMDEEEIILPEELFLSDMKIKLLEAFMPEDQAKDDAEFKALVEEDDKVKKLALTIMQNIPAHSLFQEGKEFTDDNMASEEHDRVMTKDKYQLRNDLDVAYTRESNLLDTYFSSFVAQDYPEEWQQKVIKFLYKKLSKSVKLDRGLGVGSHPWEERPARTMLVEESLNADKILDGVLGKEDWLRNEPYRIALRNCNVKSATWNYVGCNSDQEAIIKLQIIKACLLNVKVSTRQQMVLCRYVGGLRKTAQYSILSLLGYSEREIMGELKKLPF